MIKELRLRNWKSFENATLYIDPLTILIGTNASGKSNTLDALIFLNRVSTTGVGISQAITGDVNLPALRGGMEWVCRKPEKKFTLELIVGGVSINQDYRYELTVQINGTKAEVFKEELTQLTYRPRSDDPLEKILFTTKQEESINPGIPTYFATGTQGRGKRFDLNRSYLILAQTETISLSKDVKEGAKHLLSHLQKIFVFDPIPSHMRNYAQFSEKLQADGSNIAAGVLAGLEESRKNEVEETLMSYLKSLPERDIKRVWTEPVGKFKNDAMLYCEEGWQNTGTHEIDARGMSDGTLRYLAIVTALLTREAGNLLVIILLKLPLKEKSAGMHCPI